MTKRNIKHILLFLFIGVFQCIPRAQEHIVDSLKSIVNSQSNDTNKVNSQNVLSQELFNIGAYDTALIYATAAQELAVKLEYKKGIAEAMIKCGIIYSNQGNLPLSLDYFLKSLTISKEIGNKIDIASNLGNIRLIYNQEGNYPKAEEYYTQTLNIFQEIGNKVNIAKCFNVLGVLSEEQGNYDKGLDYYQKAIAINRQIGNKNGIASDLSNIGVIYSHKGKISEALDNAFQALTINREINNKYGIANNQLNIGNYFFEQKNLILSRAYLDSSLTISEEIGHIMNVRNIYNSLAFQDSIAGNYQMAFEEYKKYILFRDSIINKKAVQKIAQLEAKYEFENKEKANRTEQQKRNIITYSAIVILLLIVMLALVLINRQNLKRKKEKILFEKNLELSEKEKDMLKLEKKAVEDQLNNAKAMLDEQLKGMIEKNELLEEFKIDIENLRNLKAKEIEEARITQLENLNKTTILTEQDWDKFKNLFEQVYTGFFVRLKEKMPDLTQAEVRLFCLTKLKLDTKQMAGILGVSADTIKKTRHRLRRKLGLSEEDRIDDIADSI